MNHIIKKSASLLVAALLTFGMHSNFMVWAEGNISPADETIIENSLPDEESNPSDSNSASTPESTPDPTPASTPEPTPEPTPESTPASTPESTPASTPASTPDPTTEPEDESDYYETETEYTAPIKDNTPEEPTSTPEPTIPPKRAIVERPKVTLQPDYSANAEVEKKEENYVTFATLNIRENSMSRKLFLWGAFFIAVGVLGWVSLIVLRIRSKRKVAVAGEENHEIFAAIQEAESRSRQPQQDAYKEMFDDYEQGYTGQNPSLTEDEPLYPDEQEQYLQEDPYADFVNQSEPYQIDDYDDYSQPTAEDYTPPVSENPPAGSTPTPPSYDTEEILKEALNYNHNDDLSR